MHSNVGSMLLDTTRQYAEKIAIECQHEQLTYGDLFWQAMPLIDVLIANKQQHVAILMERDVSTYYVIYACFLSGKVYMPLSPSFGDTRIVNMLLQTKTTLVIVDAKHHERLTKIINNIDKCIDTICYEDLQRAKLKLPSQSDILSNISVPNSRNAYIMFTSGSTGVPKAIVISQQQLINYLNRMIQQYHPNQTDRFSQVIEFTFDLSIHDILLCWSVGATLLPFNGDSYFQLHHYIKTARPTFWLSVPSTGLALDRAKLIKSDCYPSLRVVLFCGEPLPYSLAAKWQHACPHASIDNLYGPTEATIAFTTFRFSQPIDNASQQIVPIGKPLPGLKIRIVNHELNQCQPSEIGELLLGGDQLINGYLTNSNTEKFITTQDGLSWYKTGDLACIDEHHILHYKGRIDDQFNVRGQRVERLDLESQFKQVLNLSSLAIIPSPVTEEGLVLGISLIYTSTEKLTKQTIIKYCRHTIALSCYLSACIRVNEFPTNASGKLDYNGLKHRYQQISYQTSTDRKVGVHD